MLRVRNKIDKETLFSSTTYKTTFFDKCIYCHADVENDYYEHEGEYIGQPFRCDCEKAKEELKAKEHLYTTLKELEKDVDVNKINKTTKEALISEIERAYEENDEEVLRYID